MEACAEISAHWWNWHPPVGAFIAILAVLGVLVPLFREWGKIIKIEKALWTFAMFALLGLELRTLYLDRNEHDSEQALARCRQLQSFQAIAATLSTAITQSQGQYQSTVTHVDGVLQTTESVAALAKENLLQMTGGDSFAYVRPLTGLWPPDVMPRIVGIAHGFSMNLESVGAQNLTGITVTVSRLKGNGVSDDGAMQPVNMGTLPSGYSLTLPKMMIPEVGPDGVAHYVILIAAQNGVVGELLDFRPSKNGYGWATKYEVYRSVRGKRKKGDYAEGTEIIRTLKRIDWTEPEELHH